MGKDGPGNSRKPNHTRGGRGGHRVGDLDTFNERNGYTKPSNDDGESSDSDGKEEQQTSKVKKSPLMERDADLEAELDAQFADPSGLTRKQREEIEKQAEERKEQKAKEAGEGEEEIATRARLEEVRKRRAEAAEKKRLAEEEAAKKKVEEEKPKVVPGKAVAEKIVELLQAPPYNGSIKLNQLNQDKTCKTKLKPLMKNDGVKALNKQFLSSFPELLALEEDGNDLSISASGK